MHLKFAANLRPHGACERMGATFMPKEEMLCQYGMHTFHPYPQSLPTILQSTQHTPGLGPVTYECRINAVQCLQKQLPWKTW